MSVQRIHAICHQIRLDTWVGIDDARAVCHKCPETIETTHGSGTRGCFLLAQKCYHLALYGEFNLPRSTPPQSDGT